MYKNIMVAVDHSPQSPQVLDEAIKLAKMSGARLHVVTIANLYEFAFDEAGRRDEGRLQVQAESKARQVLEPHLIRAEQEGVNVSAHPVVSWGAGEEIAKGREMLDFPRLSHNNDLSMKWEFLWAQMESQT